MRHVAFIGLVAVFFSITPAGEALIGSGDSGTGSLETVPPVFSIVSCTPDSLETGETVLVMVEASEPLLAAPVVTVNGEAANPVGQGNEVYEYEYRVRPFSDSGNATIVIRGRDLVGNEGTLTDTSALVFDITLPLVIWPLIPTMLLATALLFCLRMRQRNRRWFGLVVVATLFSSGASATPPVVSNVVFSQNASATLGTQVDISFDLLSANQCDMRVRLSKNGGLDGYPYVAAAISGDVANIGTGTGYHIVWSIAADYPNEGIAQATIRLIADDAFVDESGGSATSVGGAEVSVPAAGLNQQVEFHLVDTQEEVIQEALLDEIPYTGAVTINALPTVPDPSPVDALTLLMTVTVPLSELLAPGTELDVYLRGEIPGQWSLLDAVAVVNTDGFSASFQTNRVGTFMVRLHDEHSTPVLDYDSLYGTGAKANEDFIPQIGYGLHRIPFGGAAQGNGRIPIILVHGVGSHEDTQPQGEAAEQGNSYARWDNFVQWALGADGQGGTADDNLDMNKFQLWLFLHNSYEPVGFDHGTSTELSPNNVQTLETELAIARAQRGFPGAEQQFLILAHSRGGLVARAFVETSSMADQVMAAVTLATPHHGTPIAVPDWAFQTLAEDFPFNSVQQLAIMQTYWWLPGYADLAWDNFDGTFPYYHGVPNRWCWLITILRGIRTPLHHLTVNDAGWPFNAAVIDETLPLPDIYADGRASGSTLWDMNAQTVLGKFILYAGYVRDPLAKGAFFEHSSLAVLAPMMGCFESNNEDVTLFAANDGMVPLQSALCLATGQDPIYATETPWWNLWNERTVEPIELDWEAIESRLWTPRNHYRVMADLDHLDMVAGKGELFDNIKNDLEHSADSTPIADCTVNTSALSVTLDVSMSHDRNTELWPATSLEFRVDWDAADGLNWSDWSSASEITHTYPAVGNYTVTLQARDHNGMSSASLAVPVLVSTLSSGSILGWGQRVFGVDLSHGFVGVSAGQYHNLGLKADGSIVAWGRNIEGQCNIPSHNTGFIAVAAGGYHSLVLKTDGSIVAWGVNDDGQCNVPVPNTGFTAISAGSGHSLGLKADGSIVVWGRNDYGQCNVPVPNTGFVAVSAGGGNSLGLRTDGSIVAWGWNGGCDVPLPNAGFVALSAGGGHCLGLKADGAIVAWGNNLSGQCDVPAPNTGFVAVSAGGWHSLGLKADGSIIAWGTNYYGNCTVPTPNTGFIALSGGEQSIGLKADGSIVAWGQNADVPAPNTGFVAVSTGCWGEHRLGLKANGSIAAWGYLNDYGQCNVPAPNTGFVAVSAGGHHSLAIKASGSIVAWGCNSSGQCNVPAPNTGFVAVSAGWDHSLGLKADGTIIGWGWNYYGQCSVPTPNTGFVAVSAGGEHSLGLKEDGAIVAWGNNNSGQCSVPQPNTNFVAMSAGFNHCLGLKADRSIVTWGHGCGGLGIVPNTGFVSVSAGYYHSLGLKADGSVIAWGSDSFSQCSVPPPNRGFSAIAAGAFVNFGIVRHPNK